MTITNQNQEKFQQLLRELFQFDCADLDFGIYRIMNHKRDVIEKFISEDLVAAVSEELDQGILHDQELALSELQDTTQLIRETLGNKALDAAGNLNENYHDIPIGIKYLKLQRRTRGARSRATLERDIFNHLFAFFSRYYQDGDFISKRRYSRQQRYAIPYNGEEVYLHWANSDQYYIKTAEHFHDYSYRVHGATIHFKLRAADVEHNNVKGDKRFFLPLVHDITVDENTKRLTLPFEYRPLNEQEQERYGGANQQEAIIDECVAELGSRPGLAHEIHLALTAKRRRSAENEPVTYLEHHLRQYTRRNTSDFFIHKNLKAFLSRELEFYIKSEVLNLDDLELAGEGLAEGWFQVTRVIRTMGEHIIDFLEQIEGFQRLLWEKRKFITDTQYCITLAHVHEHFYPEIAACEPQWTEWQELFRVDENETDLFNSGGNVQQRRTDFMRDHPTLALDTRHFSEAFKDELLASLENIDELCDGLLIHGENWQALSFLSAGYAQSIDCIYIDPPYNTSLNDFAYKDDYQHSSWMSMMWDRLRQSRVLAKDTAGIFVSTDDGEYANLKPVMDQTWGASNFVADIIWQSRKSVSSDTLISLSTNHTTFFAADKARLDAEKSKFRLPQAIQNFSNPDNDPKGPWTLDPMDAPNIRENLTYSIVNPKNGREFWPPEGRHWRFEKDVVDKLMSEGRILFGIGGNRRPQYKRYLAEAQERGLAPTTLWDDVKTTTDATKLLLRMFGNGYFRALIDKLKPKPSELIERCALLLSGTQGTILDFFAGSGTTGHAVININREYAKRHKFIVVESADYFDSVLLPRLKKVTFTPEWKDGKPKRMATQEEAARGPRIIKYLRLESYEDALNNIEVDDSASQQAMKFDDYLLSYMLRAETRHSAPLLNVEQLARPFDYKLFIRNNGATHEQRIDLPETFNYLLGLQVQTRRTCHDEQRRYLVVRGLLDGRRIIVLWRETEGWEKAELERDKQFVLEKKLTADADEVYVNGDSFIPGAKSLDPVFKTRMFALMPE
ncbi:MAG: site-specific DNA-methyltransferase [Gammaproteobacteria bacterium]|nr:site-specific DNA-methyltransferase [Gammaproteobacteria bacterium]MCY4282575.1 site-specific DNA-methyltransferase [Gammaproteobacteria bacterium]MCY4339693.1 site-specific DNA-methyltransferase [Gammaproteobacteria bacterium]